MGWRKKSVSKSIFSLSILCFHTVEFNKFLYHLKNISWNQLFSKLFTKENVFTEIFQRFVIQKLHKIQSVRFHTEKHGNDKNSVKTTKKVKKSAVFQFHEIFSQLKKNVLLFSLACKIFREINSQCVILQFWFDGILNERTFSQKQRSSKVEYFIEFDFAIRHGPYFSGDPWNEMPRAHEAPGGIYATGIIGKIETHKIRKKWKSQLITKKEVTKSF